jgi:Domain of unknown function (DUF4145)
MDGYQFIASLFQSLTSLAWPAALIVAVWLFRERLLSLMPLLRVKYKDFDVSFRLDQAEKDAAALPPPVGGPVPNPTPEEKTRFEQIAELSPRAAIIDARRDLDEAVQKMAEIHGRSTSRRPWTLLTAIRALRDRQVISPETSALLDDLRSIGNEAAHSRENNFTTEDALRFRALADQALAQLQEANIDALEPYREPPDDAP